MIPPEPQNFGFVPVLLSSMVFTYFVCSNLRALDDHKFFARKPVKSSIIHQITSNTIKISTPRQLFDGLYLNQQI